MFTVAMNAQTKPIRQAMANSMLLEQTVFGSKDSATLENLFAKNATYIHSSGKIESRDEAIHNIIHNRSVYKKIDTLVGYNTITVNDSIIVKHAFVAKETKTDGTESILRLKLELVWIKEKKDWKLYRRTATKII